MFPDFTILGLSLYDIFFTLGLLSALIVLRFYGDYAKIPAKVLNFYLLSGVAAILGGMFSATIFQAVFNFFKTGVFKIAKDTGITFLGGLTGGIAVYLIVFFAVGKFVFKDGQHKKYLNSLLAIAPCAITLAHGIGRLGCFSTGCCGGIRTDSFLGIRFPNHTYKTYPTQLFEAGFLFILFAFFSYMFFKKKPCAFWIYMSAYGLFRFALEFLRGDERGEFFIKALSPSQALSIIMAAVGITMLALKLIKGNKRQ